MGGKRDWLVLSVKWSQMPPKPEYLIWYRTNDCGYTADLMQAGRYTEDEARHREEDGVTMAVPLDSALRQAKTLCMVEAELRHVATMRRDARKLKTAEEQGVSR